MSKKTIVVCDGPRCPNIRDEPQVVQSAWYTLTSTTNDLSRWDFCSLMCLSQWSEQWTKEDE